MGNYEMDEGKGPNPYFEGAHAGESEKLRALRLALVKERDELRADAVRFAGEVCLPNGLMFDAFGEPRTRYVRVSLGGNQCIMHPSEGDHYLKDARDAGDDGQYTVTDVYLSEREFDDLPEHNGF